MIEKKGHNIGSDSATIAGDINNENRLLKFEAQLRNDIFPAENSLEKEVKEILKGRGREKWSLQFEKLWEMNKKEQARNWAFRLKTSFVTLFNYEHHVDNYKKKIRKEIHDLFKSYSTTSNKLKWTDVEKMDKFDELYISILLEVSTQFPPKDIPAEVRKVYQNSNVIKNRKIDMKESDADSSYWFSRMMKEPIPFWKKNQNAVDSCLRSVAAIVNSIAASKQCYDDSIISNFIYDVDASINFHNFSANSEVRTFHIYGQKLIINLMVTIGREWEAENSVLAKLQRNEKDMREYFMMVSQGAEKTKLFAATLANALKSVLMSAFEKEMIEKAFDVVRDQRWLVDFRFMHKHMDLHLIDLLEQKKVAQVLDCIRQPQPFFANVLHRLIAENVPKANEKWRDFTTKLKLCITNAALATADVESNKHQNFVNQLRNEFLKGALQSEILASAFLTDFSGEYEDCEIEEIGVFQEVCTKEMVQVVDNQEPPTNEDKFANELSPKVVQYMKIRNDPVVMPCCDVHCTLCGSLCIETANHDPSITPHDAIHQPAGVVGINLLDDSTLLPFPCSHYYQNNWRFWFSGQWNNFTEYAKVFTGWKDPRINEESPLREYIFAIYNQEIANKYKRKVCGNIPAKYFRDLSSIRQQLERDINMNPALETKEPIKKSEGRVCSGP